MIYLITAPPGSGKTLYMVYQLMKYRQKWEKTGETRPVYANINGLALEHDPSPDDWRDTPEGAIVVYDEAQKIFASDGRSGVAQDDRIRAMETHRHTGHDIWLITQHPTLINQHIRKLVGKHYHIHRAAGFNRATVWEWDEAVTNPRGNAEKNRAITSESFSYPKEVFNLYQSTTLNTHKPRIPRKLLYIVFFILFFVAIAGYNLFKTYLMIDEKVNSDEPGQIQTAPGQPESIKKKNDIDERDLLVSDAHTINGGVIVTGGCIATDDACRCWAADGRILDLSDLQCHTTIQNVAVKPARLEYMPAVKVDWGIKSDSNPAGGRRLPEAKPGQTPPDGAQ